MLLLEACSTQKIGVGGLTLYFLILKIFHLSGSVLKGDARKNTLSIVTLYLHSPSRLRQTQGRSRSAGRCAFGNKRSLRTPNHNTTPNKPAATWRQKVSQKKLEISGIKRIFYAIQMQSNINTMNIEKFITDIGVCKV